VTGSTVCCGCGGTKVSNAVVCTACWVRIDGARHFKKFTGGAVEWIDWVQTEAKAYREVRE
jgi:hypothetical protein